MVSFYQLVQAIWADFSVAKVSEWAWLYGEIWVSTTLRFFAISLAVYVFYDVLRLIPSRQIQKSRPPRKFVIRDAKSCFSSCIVFALVGTGVELSYNYGLTKAYTDFDAYSLPYFIFSIWLMVTIHDFHHYWVHRICHESKWLFKHVHATHHLARTPNAFSGGLFHPIDAFLNISFLWVIPHVMPIYLPLLHGYIFAVVVFNALGHSGFEFMPKGSHKHFLLKYLITPTTHDLHHTRVHCNYGGYSNIYDRLFGSFYEPTAEVFELVTTQGDRMAEEKQRANL